LTNNYDLRIAITRVEQARAIAGQAKAQLVPRIGYEGATSRGRNEFLGNANPPGHLRSANAQVGVSVAEFLPKVGLTTFFGKVSGELSAFTAGSANARSAASVLSGPIFQGGALMGQYREAKAKREEARLRYEQTALNAFRDVADTLVTRGKLEAIRAEQARAVKAYEQAVQLSMRRYTDGKAAYFEVLEAQQQLFPAENSLARTELNRLLVVVQLYKALGGGWGEAK